MTIAVEFIAITSDLFASLTPDQAARHIASLNDARLHDLAVSLWWCEVVNRKEKELATAPTTTASSDGVATAPTTTASSDGVATAPTTTASSDGVAATWPAGQPQPLKVAEDDAWQAPPGARAPSRLAG